MYVPIVAKTSKEDNSLWLPLEWHLKDTAGVMEYLLRYWVPLALFDEIEISRAECKKIACFLAFLHDLGKATPVFQRKITEKLPEIRNQQENDGFSIKPMINDIKHAHAGAVLLVSAGCNESAAAIVSAHHGKPDGMDDFPGDRGDALDNIKFNETYYGSQNSKWGSLQKEMISDALAAAGYKDINDLPELTEAAQMLLVGLLIMSDWLASNEAYFPLISVDDLNSSYDQTRISKAIKKIDLPETLFVNETYPGFFEDRFEFKPNSMQSSIIETSATMESPGIMILEAPMGEGKTEAALAAAEVLMSRFGLGGIAFFLPTQATTNAMFDRILTWLERQPDLEKISVQLAHGGAEFNEHFAQLKEGAVNLSEDAEEQIVVHSFFRGRKTKLLSSVVVGTVDQLLMAALKQKHVMLRHLGVTGKVVIIDECHAYDSYMNVYLDRALEWLGAYHIPVILLSATLPGRRREELLLAYSGKKKSESSDIKGNISYPLISWSDKVALHCDDIIYDKQPRKVSVQRGIDDDILRIIKDAREAGGCVGIILNTIKRVQEVSNSISEQFPNAEIWIDHSQFLLPDRLSHEEEIIKRVGKKSDADLREGVIVIGTQVLEQSLDLDFDLLITDLCPMDLLMQRIGRLHRHARLRPEALKEARCVVLNADTENLEAGSTAVYGEYILLRTADLLPSSLTLPKDISVFVQRTYCEDEGKEQFQKAYEVYERNYNDKKNKARTWCLPKPSKMMSTIVGLLDNSAGFTDPQAQAAVRDGISSVEVLALGCDSDGYSVVLSGEKKGMKISLSDIPSYDEAREIARQRLKLPSRFSQQWNIDKTIDFLEDYRKNTVPEWLKSPMLDDELFVIFDEQNNAVINEVCIHYDANIGLIYEDAKNIE